MFDNVPSVFDNVDPEHRPDAGTPVPMGASPDGLGRAGPGAAGMGEYFHPTAPQAQAAGMGYAPGGMSGELAFLERPDASPAAALTTAGITSLIAASAFGIGLALGGPWGGVSGVLLSGAAFNGYRAQKWWGSPDASEKGEAVVSAIFSAIGIAAGGYTAYQGYKAKQ